MKVYIAVVAIWKNTVCCQVHLNSLKAGRGGAGDGGRGPCSAATVESWDGHNWEEDMHNSAAWKNVKPKKTKNRNRVQNE